MENTIYNVDHFIRKFESIQERSWYAGGYKNPLDFSQCCAYGHCGMELFKENQCDEGMALSQISILHLGNSAKIANVNDGTHPDYTQFTPKQRVLAALYDIKAKLEEPIPEPVKTVEKIVYVTIDKEVKELTKQPQLN